MKTILLIEDNEQNSYLIKFLLEKNNYSVTHAVDGQQALKIAESKVFDIVLLDIQLPSMDGYAVARKLRELKSLDMTAIIAVTSYAMVGDKEKAMEAGCNGYIEKPINPDTFLTEIEKVKMLFKKGQQ
ncbi:MAG: response regulator [Bdellovibrionaceae bacterium]|nr:response regulator [Pseudobdellovibrionaceae bacterium]